MRRLPRPATIDRATEAEAPVVLRLQTTGPATWLAVVVGHMQRPTAGYAAFGAAVICKITIDGEQQLVESGIGQQGCVQGRCPLSIRTAPMAKPGRNDRCPCGSGKKYKACCLTRDEAAKRQELTTAQVAPDERAAEKRQTLRAVREEMLAKLAGAEDAFDDNDDLMDASNAVVDLISTPASLTRPSLPLAICWSATPRCPMGGTVRHGAREARREPASCRVLPQGDRVP